MPNHEKVKVFLQEVFRGPGNRESTSDTKNDVINMGTIIGNGMFWYVTITVLFQVLDPKMLKRGGGDFNNLFV